MLVAEEVSRTVGGGSKLYVRYQSSNLLLEHTKRLLSISIDIPNYIIYLPTIYYPSVFYLGEQTSDIPILLIGNKLDLHERREVTEAEAKVFHLVFVSSD